MYLLQFLNSVETESECCIPSPKRSNEKKTEEKEKKTGRKTGKQRWKKRQLKPKSFAF